MGAAESPEHASEEARMFMIMLCKQSVFLSVYLIAGAAVCACAADSSGPPAADSALSVAPSGDEQTSGIRGRVLRGPLAGGPLTENQPSEAPFSATFYVRDQEGNEVARFQTDEEGAFELQISPGDYVIVPEASAPVFRPEQQPQAVTVPEGEVVELTLRFDTGMR
jgi:hypothetical protein